MFQSLRVNQQFYILHKDVTPIVEIGIVTSVSAPTIKYPQIAPNMGTQPEYVVDVVVNVNGTSQTFQKLPANKEIADFGTGNLVVSSNRDAMNAEIATLKNRSEEHLRRVDEEKGKIVAYDAILQQLNPEYADKQRQEQEISALKNQVAQMAQSNANMESMMQQLLSRLDGEKNTSKQSKN